MPTTPEPSDFQLRRSLRVLSRRRWVIIVVTVLLVTAALAFSLLQTPMYRSTAELVFEQPAPNALSTNGNTASIDPARDVQTQIEIMTSHPVRDLVAGSLHLPNPPPIAATALVGTNAMVISASATDSQSAARLANAYANAYIQYKRTQVVNDLLAAAQLIQQRIADLQSQIDGLSRQIDAAPADKRPTVLVTVGPQRDTLLAQQSLLKQELDQTQAGTTLGTAGAQITRPALPPTSPYSPKPTTSGLLALIVGLTLGTALAFGLEFLDDSVKSKDDAERAAQGAQILGLIPTVGSWKSRNDAVVISLTDPTSGSAEAYRGLRTTIQFLALDRSLRIIQVTSADAGEGKTTTLANLAVSLGRAGTRVCVVCGDLRRPRVHEFFHVSNQRGLTSVALGEVPLSQTVQSVPGCDNVFLVASGAPPQDPSELLASGRTKGILTSLAGAYDIVLIDSPPVIPVTDACVIAGRVDGVIVVVNTGRTKSRSLTRAMELLRQVDAPILGLVLNGSTEESNHPYSYSYYYTYADDTPPPRASRV